MTISPRLSRGASAPVAAVSWVAAAAVVFALVTALPLSLPLVRPGPLPALSAVTGRSFVFVFLCWEVIGAAVSLSLTLPLSVPVSVYFDRGAGPRAGSWALPFVARTATVAVASAGLGITVSVVTSLGLEVGEEGRGLMSAGWRTAAVGVRAWAGTVGSWTTASTVVTMETGEKGKRIRNNQPLSSSVNQDGW